MFRSNAAKKYSEGGQGLVEYSLILVLIAVVVVAALVILGPNVGNIFSQVADALNGGDEEISEEPAEEPTDVVVISYAGYDSVLQRLHLHATSDGGSDPSVTMTASPGGVMTRYPVHYHIYVNELLGCPCEVIVTSSAGGSATVTVGP